jgi:NodT family efflux transporter outer membrane factor (OMF) lipoprotein
MANRSMTSSNSWLVTPNVKKSCWPILAIVLLGCTYAATPTVNAQEPKRDKAAIKAQAEVQPDDWGVMRDAPLLTGSLTYVKAFPEAQWWMQYNDTHLNALEDKALSDNPDLLAVETRIQAAKASMQQTLSAFLPSIRFEPGHMTQQYARNQFVFPIQERTFRSYQLPINVEYEADIWGKGFKAVAGSKAHLHAAKSAYQSAALQLTTTVASTYFNVLKLDALITNQTQAIALAEQLLGHWQRWFEQGLIAADQVETFRQQVAVAKAQLEQLESARGVLTHQLVMLTGASSATAPDLARGTLHAITVPEQADTGIPAELVVHRPDVQQVESELKVSAMDLAVARRDLLPKLKISASTGLNSIGADELLKWYSLSSFIRPVLTVPLFEGGRLRGTYKLKKADYEQWVHRYKSTLLAAFGDVENALTQLSGDRDAYQHIEDQLASTQAKVYHEQRRIDEGVSSAPQWLPLEIQRLGLDSVLVQQKTQLLVDHVSLIKALGGGYHVQPASQSKPQANSQAVSK